MHIAAVYLLIGITQRKIAPSKLTDPVTPCRWHARGQFCPRRFFLFGELGVPYEESPPVQKVRILRASANRRPANVITRISVSSARS